MDPRRSLPSVHEILQDLNQSALPLAKPYLVPTIQKCLEGFRFNLRKEAHPISKEQIINEIKIQVQSLTTASLQKVINATGILLHTNLGRSPLPKGALEKMKDIASGYNTLEFDISTNQRSNRMKHLEHKLCLLTQSEAALVVNNNAAAILLCLNTLALRKDVLISRGELVEIGDSFRIPEILKSSGAKLHEIGTTNKTKLKDYETALSKKTACILKVHPSNYEIKGFTESVSLESLITLSHQKSVPLVFDAGSGRLTDHFPMLNSEPKIPDCIQLGCDVVTFSGDKLLGGAQAGFIVGKKKYIEKMKKNPLYRALRIEKCLISILEEILNLYLEDDLKEIPLYQMLNTPVEELKIKGEQLLKTLPKSFQLVPSKAKMGGGALPNAEIPSFALCYVASAKKVLAAEKKLRLSYVKVPVLGRVHQDKLFLDLRTILPSDFVAFQAELLL